MGVLVHGGESSNCSSTSGDDVCVADDFSTLSLRQQTHLHNQACPDHGLSHPVVTHLEFKNQCDFDIQLDGFGTNSEHGCIVPKKTLCRLGEECLNLADMSKSQSTVTNRCDMAGAGTRSHWRWTTGFMWWAAGTKIPRKAYNMLEMNSPFKGVGDRLGAVSYSQYQAWSMSSQYVALTDDGKPACGNSGGKSAVPDPVEASGELHCGAAGYDNPDNGAICSPPGHNQHFPPCNPPNQWPAQKPASPCCLGAGGCEQKAAFFEVNELLKKGSFAINGDGTFTSPASETGKVVDYWGNDFAIHYDEGGKYAGCAGSFFGCPAGAKVKFQVTACGVTPTSKI